MSNKITKDDPRLTAFVLGELDQADTEQIQGAISNSPELASAVEEIRVAVQLLGEAYQTESPMTLLEQQKSELARAVSKESSDNGVGGSSGEFAVTRAGKADTASVDAAKFKRSRLWLPIAIAASLLGLLVGGALYFDQADAPLTASKMDRIAGMSKSSIEEVGERASGGFAKGGLDGNSGAKRYSLHFEAMDSKPADFDSDIRASASSGALAETAGNVEDEVELESLFEHEKKQKLLESERVSRALQLSQLESQLKRAREDFLLRDRKGIPADRGGQEGGQESTVDGIVVGGFAGLGGDVGDSVIEGDGDDGRKTGSAFLIKPLSAPVRRSIVAATSPPTGASVVSGPESSVRPEVPANLRGVGLELVTKTRLEAKTRNVPVTRMEIQTKTRTVPVKRTRTEQRTRMVNGKEENYTVQVPYTENVTQNYTVQVPVQSTRTESYQLSVPYFAVDLPEDKADKLITELTSGLDPDGKTEFKLQELLRRSAKTWGDDVEVLQLEKAAQKQKELSDNPEPAKNAAGELTEQAAQARRLAIVLSNEPKGKSGEEADKKLGFDASDVLKTLEKSLVKRNAEIRKTRTWKRVKAVPNTTRLMVGDKDELDLTGMQVNVQVDGFRARVLIDCFYYNDRASQLEGNFKLRLPDDASLYYFAFGESAYDLQAKGELADSEFLDDGTQFVSLGAPEIREARKDAWANVKEARMVPREKAAHAYRETVRRKVDPALVEWSGAGVFNARVFPLAPRKLHRIVIGYDVNLTRTDGGWTYQLDLPEEPGQCQVDLNIQPVAGVDYEVTPNSDPFQNVINGKSHQRYRFSGKQENGVRVTANKSPHILLHSSDEDEGEFWGIQIKPDLPVEKVRGSSVGIFMVDTSLSSNPDKFNVWLEMLRATLTNNRDSLNCFNVLFFNVDGHFWRDGYVANTPENVEQLMEHCDTLALEGATDLFGALERITNSEWAYQLPATGAPCRPDLFLLSDGAATWGETNLRLIGRQMTDNNLGSLFAYQTGLTGTSIAGLRFLAGQTGGAVFSVATEDEIKTASTAHRKRPWKLKSVTAAGATDTMTAGRVQWVYPGQSLTIVGRGELDGPIELELDQASEEKTISISLDQIEQVESELASRLYGQIAVRQLESLGAKVFDVAASYARHFRVTGDTCSLLMLESQADYERFEIKPQEDLFVIKSKVAKDLIEGTLKKSNDQLADPKAQTLAWLQRLETMPGMSFKMPTALKLAMDEIEIVAISKPLECSLTAKDELSKEYLSALASEQLDYEKIATEARRRGGSSVDEAIKVYSSLVERNPGDIIVARDVAFTAMELDRPAQAYHLLKRVARARPFQGSIYPALGQCLSQLGQADMAIVYYEVALGGTFSRQGNEFKQIVSTEYMHLLREITGGKLESSVPDFAAARLETMEKKAKFKSADLVITMLWNTDQTDVDLHVVEPSGEECSYENKRTRSNGQITSDITTGFGPEMYFNAKAPQGKYDIKVKYFSNGQNRTELRNKVHLMIYRGFGTEDAKIDRRTIQLKSVGNKESVATIGIE